MGLVSKRNSGRARAVGGVSGYDLSGVDRSRSNGDVLEVRDGRAENSSGNGRALHFE